ERRLEAGGSDERVEHDIHIVARRRLDETLSPGMPCIARAVLHDSHERGREQRCLLLEQRRVVERRQRGDPEARALSLEHAERGGADRSGGAEHGDSASRITRASHAGAHVSNHPKTMNETGSTKSRLSTRSITPP